MLGQMAPHPNPNAPTNPGMMPAPGMGWGQPFQGAGGFLADTAGAPVDLVAAIMRKMGVPATQPIGGSQSIRDAWGGMGRSP
jgi:hypothetical protein